MGCGASTNQGGPSTSASISVTPNKEVEAVLEAARHEDAGKIKLLLLGAGESGKSTIFKQMRLLYGAPRSDDDLRMYGVVARSNIVVAIRKLLIHLRALGLEEELDRESKENEEFDAGDPAAMTCRQAYDELVAHLVDHTATLPQDEGGLLEGDWVGRSARAGVAANVDARLFLQHFETIRILWQVRREKHWVSCLKLWKGRRGFSPLFVLTSHNSPTQ